MFFYVREVNSWGANFGDGFKDGLGRDVNDGVLEDTDDEVSVQSVQDKFHVKFHVDDIPCEPTKSPTHNVNLDMMVTKIVDSAPFQIDSLIAKEVLTNRGKKTPFLGTIQSSFLFLCSSLRSLWILTHNFHPGLPLLCTRSVLILI